ncbi:6-phosphogluconolactonase [Qingshengfaniella alkalisoli]|uniref:6-phosphogluconolactonase n=1 Tax=Qingshengfaniella alkalisoli TaxID=2599296 RepID=A0A5B8ITL1_9RHOB|nr:6-phosphogluconolactonase [Qingshengfaniella alkalisoli]QDY68793.1 6-phosphogluconolactonase [Qingshengfaniella alkalisoli]
MKFKEYPDRDMMMIDLANALAGELNQALSGHDAVSFAVPGGTTPGPVFDTLAAVDLDWDRVTVMLTDERWVPEDSKRSNTKLVKERLLTDKAAAAQFLPFYTGENSADDAMADLADRVAPHLPLSVCLLGMGADMHTASLFPGADRLGEALAADAPHVLPMRADGAPEPRITLTAPVLRGAMSLHVVITGAEKRKALERARELDDPAQAPVCVVLKDATVHWAE